MIELEKMRNRNITKIKFPLLLSRLLTRSGDQAWDFAVPIIMLTLFPTQMNITAIYYLFVRLAQVFLTPHLASFIDRMGRLQAIRMGIGLQTVSIFIEFLGLYGLMKILPHGIFYWQSHVLLIFVILIFSGIGSNLGSTFMNIAVANDIVPALFEHTELVHVNGRLKQIDLFTEVTSPVLAGLLLLIKTQNFPLLGLSLIVFWNLFSFLPEYRLLLNVFRLQPELMSKKLSTVDIKKTFFQKLLSGWKSFFHQPVAIPCLCYAILWLSVLSPHGVLLTAFLKGGWKISEPIIGMFRGAGALFGLVSTLVFPFVFKRYGLIKTGRIFIQFQSLMLIIAFLCFYFNFQFTFLIFILFSRIGLYGFSLGETQIRQEGIPETLRGEINGLASALTSLATLFLYASGSLISAIDDFHYLIFFSVGSVGLSALIFTFWSSSVAKNFFRVMS